MIDREKNIEAIRAACRRANPDRPTQAGRDVWERDLYIGIGDVLLASHKAGRNLAVHRTAGAFWSFARTRWRRRRAGSRRLRIRAFAGTSTTTNLRLRATT